MKLALVVAHPLPSRWAHGVQISQMCAAFAALGVQVTLVVPAWPTAAGDDVAGFYGVPDSFALQRVRAPAPSQVGRDLARLAFVLGAAAVLLADPPDLVLTRDELAAAVLAPWLPAFYEVHKSPVRGQALWGWLCGRATGVVSTNRWKRDLLVTRHGLATDRVLVCPNAVDLARFGGAAPAPLRQELGLGEGTQLVLYVGHLYDWKGVGTLIAAAASLAPGVATVLVGGLSHDVARWREAAGPGVHLPGPRPHAEVPGLLAAADVLVLPNLDDGAESRHETSPLKLFEYMAAGRAIVASDLPSLREWLDGDCAVLVPPGDAAALAEAVTALLADPRRRRTLGAAAQARVAGRSWGARARRILDFAEARRGEG